MVDLAVATLAIAWAWFLIQHERHVIAALRRLQRRRWLGRWLR